MADFPKTVHIVEEGPREGFQFEPQVIPTARKIELALALAETGLERLIEVARLAEEIVGHPLPGAVMHGGSLARYRQRGAA